MPQGGGFAAFEEPDTLGGGLRLSQPTTRSTLFAYWAFEFGKSRYRMTNLRLAHRMPP